MNNLKKQVANCVLNDFVPDPILYNIFRSVEVLPEGNLGYVRNGLTGLYYRLTMPAGISRIAAYVDDPATPATPAITNPLLEPAVTANNIRVRWEQLHPTPERPYGYDAVAAINNFQAPDLSTTSGIFNWCINTFVVRQNNAATPHRTPDVVNAPNNVPLTATSTLVARQLRYNAEQGATGLYQTAVMYTDVQSDCVDGGILTSTTGIRDWIKELLLKYVLTTTLTAEYKPTGADATYASQIEFTTLQGEITTIQEQMVALGIATVVNGVLTAVTESIQAGAVATALAKCMKLSGTQTLTGSITWIHLNQHCRILIFSDSF